MNTINGYFDYAAATPQDKAVTKAQELYLNEVFYNPSALYTPAIEARDALAEIRHGVARLLGAKPSEIVFTSGGTEANNLAIHGVMERFPDKRLLVSAVEHDSVLNPAKKYRHEKVAVSVDGKVIIEDLRNKLDDDVVLVSIMLVNNEVGTVQPIKEVAELIASIRKERLKKNINTPLFLHTDACQAIQFLDCTVARLGVDMMTLNGGKIYGPKQSGCLVIGSRVHPVPQLVGGGQEYGLRSGTESLAQSSGFMTALSLVHHKKQEAVRRLKPIQDYLIGEIENLGGVCNGSKKERVVNNIHVTFSGVDNETLLYKLDQRGFMVATGSACSAQKDSASHVLLAMGMSEEQAKNSIRITTGKYTTPESAEHFIAALKDILGTK